MALLAGSVLGLVSKKKTVESRAASQLRSPSTCSTATVLVPYRPTALPQKLDQPSGLILGKPAKQWNRLL